MFNAYYDNFYQGCLNDKITIEQIGLINGCNITVLDQGAIIGA